MKIKSLAIAGMVATVATGAFAEGENIVTSKGYVDTTAATKQPILETKSGDYAVIYPNSTNNEENGAVGQREIVNSVSGTATGLVTAGAVNTAVNAKQEKIAGSAALNGKVITYTGTAGTVGQKDIYDSSIAYSGQTGSLVEAQHVNDAVTSGFNAHLTCVNEPDCTLWQVNTLTSAM